ncbi:MAG: site-specific tyrosine recombinase/integron integrase [Bdellovibrionota bacterium]
MQEPDKTPLPLQSEIDDFLESRRVDRGSADKTVEAYRRDLLQFAAWLKPARRLGEIEAPDLEAFLTQLHRNGQKAASIARKISALKQFFKFCALEKGLRKNPTERIESPSQPKRLPKHLDQEAVTRLLATTDEGLPYLPQSAAKESAPTLADALRARDRAMVYLLYASGLRVSELVSLTTHQLDLQLAYVRVRGKGSKERICPFAPVAGDRLKIYVEKHRPILKPTTDHLFLNQRGFVLTRQSLWGLLKDLAVRAGLSGNVSPHVLRHSFATHLLQSGMNLRSLQMLLGHADLSTTQIYAHVTPEHLKTAHKKYHPRGD